MKLIVGLGNPGEEYESHRHNVGFLVIDELLRRCGATTTRKFQGEMARVRLNNVDAILLKPMTYMNNSGISVGLCGSFYKVDPEDMVVVHDEMDLDYGMIRVKKSGGHAGHNGLRSIFQHYSKGDFPRVRVGIGRPQACAPTKHVLSPFNTDERIGLDTILDTASNAVETACSAGVDEAMNQFNQRQLNANVS
jgi:PTH1 family peptidyl-tRNA hydrolase